MAVIFGRIVDILNRRIFSGKMVFDDRGISTIIPDESLDTQHYIIPGFIDAHVHIESSMLIPAEFARLAVVHGTVGTVSDPHEIANVCGLKGVAFMIENGKTVPFKFNFGAPSCVPATVFETAGAVLNARDVETLLKRDDIKYLSEMMNFPGVLNKDGEVMMKIKTARSLNKAVDGHAPGLRGEKVQQYINAGISTDHECFTKEEALEKLKHGMKIIIREGSAAKNFDALVELLHDYPDKIMFCSDDKHPDSLVMGHINQLCTRAVARGVDVFNVLQAACINPVKHYKLDIGILETGHAADFIVVTDLKNFEVLQTYINGQLVAQAGKTHISPLEKNTKATVNHFNCAKKMAADFAMPWKGEKTISVIEALDGQLITNKLDCVPVIVDQHIVSDIDNDVLKIVVVNRYNNAPVAKAFIKNIGLKQGAIASSVAHDSHNIVAVGADDESICRAVNLIIEKKGGISCINSPSLGELVPPQREGRGEVVLPLPIAGLMSNEDGYKVAEDYTAIDAMAKSMGSSLSAPFMTLSFMALLVIPSIKLSDMGLFNGNTFEFINKAND
jgi:adenine deaminase